MNVYTFELHYEDIPNTYINISGSSLMDTLQATQWLYHPQLVTIPMELYEDQSV